MLRNRSSSSPGKRSTTEHHMPEHMAPKRSQWTSPPPPEASPERHAIFQDQLDHGIALATVSTLARECAASATSGDSLEILNDEESRSEAAVSDDVQSNISFNEGSIGELPGVPVTMVAQPFSSSRGRLITRPADPPGDRVIHTIPKQEAEIIAQKADLIRRSQSGPPNRKVANRFSWPSAAYPSPILFQTSPSIRSHRLHVQIPSQIADTSTVFYETTATRSRIPQPLPNMQEHTVDVTLSTYPTTGSQFSSMSTYHRTNELRDGASPSLEHDLSAIHLSDGSFSGEGKAPISGMAGLPSLAYPHISFPHRHVPSIVTTTSHPDQISTPNPQSSSPALAQLARRHFNISTGRLQSRSPSQSPLRTSLHQIPGGMEMHTSSFSYPASYVNCPSTPSSSSRSPSSPTQEEPSRYSSQQPLVQIPGLKAPMNFGQPHPMPSVPGSVKFTGSPRSVTPLR
ncbi:hypothetical protein JVU11DRAFT_8865 [Chiua virens]|nr:hypothetical protein JVU11DRAFT_8865 [Chiua virens]